MLKKDCSIHLDQYGRVTVGDTELEAMIAEEGIPLSGGSNEATNSICNNTSTCSGSLNTSCANYPGMCSGSTNGRGTCGGAVIVKRPGGP